MDSPNADVDLHARLDGIQHETARAHREIATHEATLTMLDARLKSVENTVGAMALSHDGEMEGLCRDVQALTASVGIVRADVTALQAQEPVRVLLTRIETLSDERNAARRDLMRVVEERDEARAERDRAIRNAHLDFREHARQLDALKTERDAAREAQQEATLYRAVVTRVRSGDLVRCLTCEGRGHCADCEDDHGEPRYGVAGLVPPDVNAPLSVDVDLTPEEMKP